MLCLSRKRMVVTKDRPHGPGRSVPMLIVVECEDHSAIQAPLQGDQYDYVSTTWCGWNYEVNTSAQKAQLEHCVLFYFTKTYCCLSKLQMSYYVCKTWCKYYIKAQLCIVQLCKDFLRVEFQLSRFTSWARIVNFDSEICKEIVGGKLEQTSRKIIFPDVR